MVNIHCPLMFFMKLILSCGRLAGEGGGATQLSCFRHTQRGVKTDRSASARRRTCPSECRLNADWMPPVTAPAEETVGSFLELPSPPLLQTGRRASTAYCSPITGVIRQWPVIPRCLTTQMGLPVLPLRAEGTYPSYLSLSTEGPYLNCLDIEDPLPESS